MTGARPTSATRRRLDLLLVERGLVESRSRAQALIAAGLVYSGAQRLDKPGLIVPNDQPLELRGQDHPWVSRGGVKLAHVLDHFAIDPADGVWLDIGASTGGFTDVLLARGAAKVYAVDVGHGQLAEKLRHDPRVLAMERTNARHLGRREIPEPLDGIACDASFIGLATILPAALALAAPGARLVALIKPQFEVGRAAVGKGGIVRDPARHREVCARVAGWLGGLPGWSVLGVIDSPIAGADGNREFLIAGRYDPT
jgi:23S rRNA (cytidine1920-2'-O)/16S rRNA (cytidine1409-2'-O)-methyltransferase